MMIKKIFMLSISAILLQACQTTNEQTDPVSVYYQGVISKSCIISSHRAGDQITGRTQKASEAIYIYSVVEGDQNWRRIDSSTKGFRDSVYHNTSTGKVICGFKNWQNRGKSRDIFAKTTPVTSVK